MKTFNPKDDTSVFDIEEFLKRDSYGENDIVEAVELLGRAWQEVKILRDRLEIDRYYLYNPQTKKSELELSRNNKMLYSVDKIRCLEIEVNELCQSVIDGDAKSFVEMNFPEYN